MGEWTASEAHEQLVRMGVEQMENIANCLLCAERIKADPTIVEPIVDRLVERATTYLEAHRSGTPTRVDVLRRLARGMATEPLLHTTSHDESEGYDCLEALLPWDDVCFELAGDELADIYEMEVLWARRSK